MAQRVSEQVERLARIIWSQRFTQYDMAKVAHRYGFTKDEIRWLDWAVLPDAIKVHLHDMAQREIESGEDG